MWIWVASGLVLSSIGLAVYSSLLALRGRRMISFRRLYLQQLARLEQLVAELSHYGNLLQTNQIDDEAILERFEASLQRTEALLASINLIPSFQLDRSVLQQFAPLIRSCENQMDFFKEVFRQNLSKTGKTAEWIDDWFRRGQPPTRGCFFCSRPYLVRSFAEVRIKFEDKSKKVWACHVCRTELKAKGELKVLYFRIDGTTRHWSEHPGYDPARHFGSIGETTEYRPRPLINLVKAEDDSANS